MLKFKNIVILILVAITVHGLPTYIKKCRKSDPKLDECILASTKLALPEIMKGDPSLLIPDLNSYNPADQVLKINENFVFTLKNIKAESGELVPVSAKMDFNSLTLDIGMHMPFLVWRADFIASVNDVQEHGSVNITFDDLQFDYKKHLEEKEIDGKIYLQVKSESTTGSIKSIDFHQDYDGETNVEVQKKVNKLVPKIKNAVKETLLEICGQLVTYILNTTLKSTPKDDVFLQ